MTKPADEMQDRKDLLLLEYATGALDEASALMVAAWLTLSPSARRLAAQYERLGGALLYAGCEPVQMEEHSLNHVLSRLEEHPRPQQPALPPEIDPALPLPLQTYISKCAWRTVGPGVRGAYLAFPGCASQASLFQLRPGIETARPCCDGFEITLVLKGSYKDDAGLYQRGDLVIRDAGDTKRLHADRRAGCLSFVVADRLPRRSHVQRLLDIFR